ncbi:MAG: MAPEG family protein [Beijerinckiaceae bacterium]
MSVALWSVLFAALLPILTVGFAKRMGGRYNNNDPRKTAAQYEGVAKRAYAAHQNGYEAFPLFAAAVLVAEMKGAPRGLVDMLALGYVALRIGYVGAYMADKPNLRSILWALSLFAAIAIFIAPLWR